MCRCAVCCIPTLRRNILLPFSEVKIKIQPVCFLEKLANCQKIIWHNNVEATASNHNVVKRPIPIKNRNSLARILTSISGYIFVYPSVFFTVEILYRFNYETLYVRKKTILLISRYPLLRWRNVKSHQSFGMHKVLFISMNQLTSNLLMRARQL